MATNMHGFSIEIVGAVAKAINALPAYLFANGGSDFLSMACGLRKRNPGLDANTTTIGLAYDLGLVRPVSWSSKNQRYVRSTKQKSTDT